MFQMDSDIINIIQAYKQKFLNADCAIAGVNGPYDIEETPIRTTAHWIITFSIMYEQTKDRTYFDIIKRFSEYIKDKVDKTENGAVICLLSDKDNTNGLIGLAWTIEALIRAADVLQSKTYLLSAQKIYDSQMYDWKNHIWHIVDSEGTHRGIDRAFNHNLWFAASGYQLALKINDKLMQGQVDDFVNNMNKHFFVYKSGLLSHFTYKCGKPIDDCKTMLRFFFCQLSGKGTPWNSRNIVEYERAYHLFSMYAFARLFSLNPHYEFWNTKKFSKLKRYALNINNFLNYKDEAEYAYFYNSPAFEYPLIYFSFAENKNVNTANILLENHKKIVWNSAEEVHYDRITLDARIYELMQYYEIVYNRGCENEC